MGQSLPLVCIVFLSNPNSLLPLLLIMVALILAGLLPIVVERRRLRSHATHWGADGGRHDYCAVAVDAGDTGGVSADAHPPHETTLT